MNGIHDMGGMHGFGPIEVEPNEPVFHEDWEGRVFGLMITTGAKHLRAPRLRPLLETLDPAFYLEASYYERWLAAVERGLVEAGTLKPETITARTRLAELDPTADVESPTDPEFAQYLVSALTRVPSP